jgi:hypothetical protein
LEVGLVEALNETQLDVPVGACQMAPGLMSKVEVDPLFTVEAAES